MGVAEAMKRALVIGIALAALAAGCGSTKTITVTQVTTTEKTVTTTETVTTTSQSSAVPPCSGADLKGSLDVQAGSAGAGTITYTLTLINTSSDPCMVNGTPVGILLDNSGQTLPTNVLPVPAAQGSAQPVVLQPGDDANADARFSPDVAGTGDAQTGRCQPVAHVFQVTAGGGGTVDAPITPPTSVCERGTLSFRPFA
jgi:hypothetical protein